MLHNIPHKVYEIEEYDYAVLSTLSRANHPMKRPPLGAILHREGPCIHVGICNKIVLISCCIAKSHKLLRVNLRTLYYFQSYYIVCMQHNCTDGDPKKVS